MNSMLKIWSSTTRILYLLEKTLEVCEDGPKIISILFDSSIELNCFNISYILFATGLISDILSIKPLPEPFSKPELLASTCRSFTIYRSALTLNVNLVPTPILDTRVISPLRLLHIFLQIERPKPTPLGFKLALNLRVQKSVNIFGISDSGIPVPVSFTEMKSFTRYLPWLLS